MKRRVSGRRSAQGLCLVVFLVLFFYLAWPDRLEYGGGGTEGVGYSEFFLALDPLVAVSTAVASRAAVWSLTAAGVVLLIGVAFPRWFCGYVCPLGTLIDVFDGGLGRRVRRWRVTRRGWWVHLRFYVLAGVLAAAVAGVLLSGFVAALAVATRGLVYIAAPVQAGLLRGWESVPGLNAGQYVSIALFVAVFGLGLLRPRFWCAYVCPSGALLSVAGMAGVTRRTVDGHCTQCGRCRRVCSFDAIAEDYSTRVSSCTTCGNCQRACPQGSIRFVGRWRKRSEAPALPTCAGQPVCTRRGLFLGLLGATGAGIGAATGLAYAGGERDDLPPVRPPGAVPEGRFRRQCIRCGQCIRVCPTNVLEPTGFELGIDGLWTPALNADFAGCDPQCLNCGLVCPTGAIRELPREEKRAARLGLAVIDAGACLPHCGKEACGLCLSECAAAGYHAIEYVRVGVEYDGSGAPIAGSGLLAPVVLKEKCVGCGLCQARCRAVNVAEKRLLDESAVQIAAGPGREDRIVAGSYVELRKEREARSRPAAVEAETEYLPDFLR